MKKKSILPVSRGELRAITITSLVICLSVVLPPHLVRILQAESPPHIEITEFGTDAFKQGGIRSDEISTDGNPRRYADRDDSSSKGNPRRYTDQDVSSSKGNQRRYADQGTNSFKRNSPQNHGRDINSSPGNTTGNTTSNYNAKNNSTHGADAIRHPCSGFDPNSISGDSLRAWGLSSYVVTNILKYRSSGGGWRKPEDLRHVYGMDSAMYGRISACIEIAKEAFRPVYINTADTSQWMALPGIGPVLSRRIIKFRDKLGGFYSIEQVANTYGLPIETYEVIRPILRMRTGPKPLNLTTATESQLASHPYISLKQARVMINYFNQHGRPKSLDDLGNLYIADSLWLARVRPYCIIDTTSVN